MQIHETTPILNEQADAWQASECTRRWLLFGIFAAFTDGGLYVICTVLEVRFWEQEGLTPDTFVAYAAILPQMVVLAAFLTLAKDVGGRGLWKGAAGFFACGWGCFSTWQPMKRSHNG